MIRPDTVNDSVEMKDWERLGLGVRHVPKGGDPVAGREESAVQQAGHRILREGIIYTAKGSDTERLMVQMGSKAQ